MEQPNQTKVSKTKQANHPTVGLRVRRDTKKRIQAELAKVNKKAFGRIVKADSLVMLAVSLLTEVEIRQLQTASLSNGDRLEMSYQEYIKRNGPLTKDEYLGKLLTGESSLGGDAAVVQNIALSPEKSRL